MVLAFLQVGELLVAVHLSAFSAAAKAAIGSSGAHQLRGCLTPPSTNSFARPPATTTDLVSALHPCAGHCERAHPVVKFYNPK
jgi:hypothetical protein